MAWVSPKVYAILSQSEEGKDIIEKLPDLTQEECQEELDAFFGDGGKGASSSNDYLKAKKDDEDYESFWGSEQEDDEDKFEPTTENIFNKQRETENNFNMPESEGWKPSNQGEKSFIKNEGKDNEMFIQYNGQDYDGSNQEYVAGYMKNGDYVSEKFDNLEDAKDFLSNADNEDDTFKKEVIENSKEDWVKTSEDEELWNSLSDDEKYLLGMSNDMGFWFDEISDNEDAKKQYDEISSKFSINKPKKSFNEASKKSKSKDYTSVKNLKSRLSSIIGDVSHYTSDKSYDVLDFRNMLEKNGFKVDYIENKSGTWQDRNGEKHKEYDIKLDDGTHIYFDLIADENYDTKEVIAYKNGKGW